MTHDSKTPNLPALSGPLIDKSDAIGRKGFKRDATKSAKVQPAGTVSYSAQVLSGGEQRGLKGGAETLERAKSTYLKSEYSGKHDRRPKAGLITKTEI